MDPVSISAIVFLFGLVMKFRQEQLDECRTGRDDCEKHRRAQQDQLDALIAGDPEAARAKRASVLDAPQRPRQRRSWRMWAVAFLALAAVAGVVACGQTKSVSSPPEVPAEIEARDLAQQHTAELRAAIDHESAAAALVAAGNPTAAEPHRIEAERHRALAAEIATLRAAAEARIADQQRELDRRTAEIERQADARAAARRQAEDDRWMRLIAGGGIFIAILAGVFLSRAPLPGWITAGAPLALAAGCAFLAVWPTIDRGLIEIVRWSLIVVAVVVALAVLALLASGLGVLVREVRTYADHAAEPGSAERQALDQASRERQPRLVRWLLDHCFRRTGST
jgi:hypothetical protein